MCHVYLSILGMDWLIKNHCKMDFINRTIQCNDHTLNFLNENEMVTYKNLVSDAIVLNNFNLENKQFNEVKYDQNDQPILV